MSFFWSCANAWRKGGVEETMREGECEKEGVRRKV
jgi:hypothetical protein